MATDNQVWYELIYNGFDNYDEEPYTQQTSAEVDFIEAHLGKYKNVRLLDVGCGTGRHSLELARRGYRNVTGVDLSASMLQQAREKARSEELTVTFVQKDARRLQFESAFDVILMLCEGGFSLMETDEADRQILHEAARALHPGGKLIMTAPNAAFMIAGKGEMEGFDPFTLRERFHLEKDGERLACSQRYYTFPELRCLLAAEGLIKIAPFAVGDDGYRKNQLPRLQDYEFGVTAVRK